MSAWPSSLPQQLFLGATERDEDSRVRSAMDAGPPTVRRRYTSAPRRIGTAMVLNGTQKATFDTFYRTTLNDGTDSFTWTDPVDDASITYRFVSPPKWTCIRGGTTANRLWQTTLELEVIT